MPALILAVVLSARAVLSLRLGKREKITRARSKKETEVHEQEGKKREECGRWKTSSSTFPFLWDS